MVPMPTENDVDVAEGGDDALADGVVPARDVRDDRNAETTRADQERNGRVRLDVREHHGPALSAHAQVELARHVAPRAEVPALHPAFDQSVMREHAVA